MIDLEKRVGLATHCAVTEQCPDDDRVLHFRQTSHGITQSYGADRTAPRRLGSTVISRCETDISAGPPQTLRCQTLPSMWTLGKDEPVIPGVPFIR